MTANIPHWRGLIATTLLVFGWAGPVRAAELDCEKMAASLNPGDHYTFQLEIQSKAIRLEKGNDFCTEPAKVWFKRQLILPPPAREEMPLPKVTPSQPQRDNAPLPGASDNAPMPIQQIRKDYVPDMGLATDTGGAPLPIKREFVQPKVEGAPIVGESAPSAVESQQPAVQTDPAAVPKDHVSSDPNAAVGVDAVPGSEQSPPVFGVVAPPPPKRDDALAKRCDRDLTDFWSPGEHEIEGQKFWLSGVFTVDLDSDGRVDDVGFKIKSEGKIGNILNYFPSTEGRLSGKTIKSLKLDDDRDIHRLCPGNITFERADPAAVIEEKKIAVSEVKTPVKDGGKETAAAEAVPPEEVAAVPELPKKKTKSLVLVVAGIAMVLLLAGGIGLAMALRNMARSRKDEYEDDDEDD